MALALAGRAVLQSLQRSNKAGRASAWNTYPTLTQTPSTRRRGCPHFTITGDLTTHGGAALFVYHYGRPHHISAGPPVFVWRVSGAQFREERNPIWQLIFYLYLAW